MHVKHINNTAYITKLCVQVFNAFKSGELCGRIQTNFVLSEIQLWYSSGYGKQPMYDVTIYVNLKSVSDKEI